MPLFTVTVTAPFGSSMLSAWVATLKLAVLWPERMVTLSPLPWSLAAT